MTLDLHQFDLHQVDFVEVDFDDDDQIAVWHQAYLDSQIASRGENCAAFTLADLVPAMRNQAARFTHQGWTGFLGGTPVASLWLGRPMSENAHLAKITVDVVPAYRRLGIGTRALAFLEDRAAAAGRSTVIVPADWPSTFPVTGQGAEGPEFLGAHGYTLALGELQRRLDLPVAAAVLDRFSAETAERAAGYRLESCKGPVPDAWLADYAALDAAIETEAPTGDLAIEPTTPDTAAVRINDANEASSGRTRYGTYAFDADGVMVAFSDLVTPAHEPGRAYQLGTLVKSGHRGHRLGMAVKVANLKFLQDQDPSITHVLTWNAGANAHMIGVNEELGFRISEHCGEFQKSLN